MSFKQFLKKQHGIDMVAFRRKPEEVQASIIQEYERKEGEEKRSIALFRKSNQARRSKTREEERRNKQARQAVSIEEGYDGADEAEDEC